MNQKFLKAYSGQTTEQLIALDGEYRLDSIVLAFEQAIQQVPRCSSILGGATTDISPTMNRSRTGSLRGSRKM